MNTQQAAKKYLVFCYSLAPKTKKIYTQHLARLCNVLGDDLLLADVTNWDMVEFMDGLYKSDGQPYSDGYKHQIWRTLNTFFEFCVREEWIAKNPMKNIPKPRRTKGTKNRLTLEQIGVLINATPLHAAPGLEARNTAIVLLMIDSGLRLSEVANLRFLDIHLDDGTVYIADSKTRTSREVPISLLTIKYIQSYIRRDRPRPGTTEEKFFLDYKHKKPITVCTVHSLLKRLEKHVGYPLHAHLLRHTFANHYNRTGNLRKLQKILGHSCVSTTADYYTDPDMADIIAEHRQSAPSAQL